MLSISTLRQSSKLGIALVSISALTGCLGGAGGSSAASIANNNVSCTPGSATGVAAANCMLVEMGGTGTVSWSGYVASISIISPTATAGTYTGASINRDLNSAGTAWVPAAAHSASWVLTSNGWVLLSPSTATLLDNSNGTMDFYNNNMASGTYSVIIKTDLSGQGVVCKGGTLSGGTPFTCPTPANYPSGSTAYSGTGTHTVESYYLWDSANSGGVDVITNSAGVALVALPALGSTVCISISNGAKVYSPIAPTPGAGLDNYHTSYVTSCSAITISAALANPSSNTELVASKTVNGAAMWTMTTNAMTANEYTEIAAFNAQTSNRFMTGSYNAAGTTWTWDSVNKIAANAQLRAHSLPALP